MSARDASRDRPCPACGAMSEHEPPEMVDIGVGEQQVSPDEWCCPVHGLWCVPAWDAPPVFERPDPVRAEPPEPSRRHPSTATAVRDLLLTGADLAGRVLLAGVVIAGAFALAGLYEAAEAIRARSRCLDCGAPTDADRCDDCDEQARGGA